MHSDEIPLFPLSLVVFPGEVMHLHIFEPRYKQLIHDCLKNHIGFGIPPYIEGKNIRYGTEVLVTEVSKVYEDGKMDIKIKGTGWFEIVEFYRILHGKLYPGGVINRMSWYDKSDMALSIRLVALIHELYGIMKIDKIIVPAPEHFKTYLLAHKLGLNIDQEIEFLTISGEQERQLYLIEHLESLIPVVREAETIRKRAELNGHFQYIVPPEF